jgi:hypothetical protein
MTAFLYSLAVDPKPFGHQVYYFAWKNVQSTVNCLCCQNQAFDNRIRAQVLEERISPLIDLEGFEGNEKIMIG